MFERSDFHLDATEKGPRFNVIDLNNYGSPMEYLDFAFMSIEENGNSLAVLIRVIDFLRLYVPFQRLTWSHILRFQVSYRNGSVKVVLQIRSFELSFR